MAHSKGRARPNILIVAQSGRLEYEALIFMASLRHASPDWTGRVIIAEPLPQGAWQGRQTAISQSVRGLLSDLGAEILPFTAEHFGASYPQGNKIEALTLLPANEPFIFFDTDTLITGPLDRLRFDFTRPAASMMRTNTWPAPPLYGPGYEGIWRSIYDRFGVEFDSSVDPSHPKEHWERFLYFNAGWFFGGDPAEFGRRYLGWALALRDEPHEELACQVMDPWLDQAVLPVVIHSLGGGRPGKALAGLDGHTSCHYRKLPLLYARHDEHAIATCEAAVAPREIKRVLKEWEPARKLIYQQKGRTKVQPIFAGDEVPRPERAIRNQIRRNGWWLV
ncbi:hypothetical protein Q4511_11395 [Paracoccus sp. 1_MG-2023]|uniref:hypothetical protein n=1 Tax=unclassified Paracoccus (in: a-proteobacteria) TaxID=2688777 RepID=UPI001C085600|nr:MULTISPECIES: hypothetical protein [unclassified Paracoccus (in: a-proteobacteria)]MBU2957139.1 hypothetical protein [Paracoccus sp. C2R09]MDO6669527.1 hypothetical protein [Paracoccus sp. 1_MG-2023]